MHYNLLYVIKWLTLCTITDTETTPFLRWQDYSILKNCTFDWIIKIKTQCSKVQIYGFTAVGDSGLATI